MSNINRNDVYAYFIQHKFDTLINNGVINIVKDVKVLSIMLLRNLQNILIIGHGSPTINCDGVGGVYFENCYNCTVTGITWDKCGSNNGSKPAIEIYNSSHVMIQNCTFQHSITRALQIYDVSGNISIIGSKFLFNNKFEGHGAAIYYLSKIKYPNKLQFTVDNCVFMHNAVNGNGIVYISSLHNKSSERLLFSNFAFLNYQGIPIYISHHTVIASGKITFKGNAANNSGGIFITNHSNLIQIATLLIIQHGSVV